MASAITDLARFWAVHVEEAAGHAAAIGRTNRVFVRTVDVEIAPVHAAAGAIAHRARGALLITQTGRHAMAEVVTDFVQFWAVLIAPTGCNAVAEVVTDIIQERAVVVALTGGNAAAVGCADLVKLRAVLVVFTD
jgi:hypothetical protein